ncbi:uncharacterized protein PHALS_14635 [Plasmopara halstedii]|uniref:Uncharacterized protein n=1 Tax=Plasmopara halstedii TaxID=4781 RepID=A0A0N7L5V4_PLAHL|nr:uncharacterized protein PHALS_14635 [Plasmopara halstedii]CEG42523.1 hypothetical protein PHALS_14635 [Plasmopara halstedii]|eukprot:XP_024578892.1 hypothetical protein PHALS_14635 [Plasmopara halstedii]
MPDQTIDEMLSYIGHYNVAHAVGCLLLASCARKIWVAYKKCKYVVGRSIMSPAKPYFYAAKNVDEDGLTTIVYCSRIVVDDIICVAPR